MFRENVNAQHHNLLDINLASKCTHRQRILNTFIRCRNRAREAGNEFEYFRVPSERDDSNDEFGNIQFLDSTGDSEPEINRSLSPSDSDDYSWSSGENTTARHSSNPAQDKTTAGNVCSGRVFLNQMNYDVYRIAKKDILAMTPKLQDICSHGKCDCPSESSTSSCSMSDHSESEDASSEVPQDAELGTVPSSNFLKRSRKLARTDGSSDDDSKLVRFEDPSDEISLDGGQDGREDVSLNEIPPSNSNATNERIHEHRDNNPISTLGAPAHCRANTTHAQSFPPIHHDPITETGSLLCQYTYNDRPPALNGILVESSCCDNSEPTPKSKQGSSQMPNPCIQNNSGVVTRVQNSNSIASSQCGYFAGHSEETIQPGRSVGWPEGYHICTYCEMGFGSFLMYMVHTSYHCLGNPFRCRLCGQQCQNKVDFYAHITFNPHIPNRKGN